MMLTLETSFKLAYSCTTASHVSLINASQLLSTSASQKQPAIKRVGPQVGDDIEN